MTAGPTRPASWVGDLVPAAAGGIDKAGVVLAVNDRWTEATGLSEAESVGSFLVDLVDPADRDVLLAALGTSTAVSGGAYIPWPVRVRTRLPPDVVMDAAVAVPGLPRGTPSPIPDPPPRRWLDLTASGTGSAVPDPDDGTIVSTRIVLAVDVTAILVEQEHADRLAAIVERTSDLVGISDSMFGIVYLNEASRIAFGLEEADLEGRHTFDLYTPESFVRYYDEVRHVLLRGESWSGELTMFGRDGEERTVWQTIVAKAGEGGTIEWLATVGRDVTEWRRIEARLAHDATHDDLTGLPNRNLLFDRLTQALARMAREGPPVGVLFLDIDHFKSVNDRFGHDVGDDVLRSVATRLRSLCRPMDTVARFGGDEFVVLCDGVRGTEEAVAIARRICDGLRDLAVGGQRRHPRTEAESATESATGVDGPTSREWDGDRIVVGVSVGVAVAEVGSADPEALLRQADLAMYRAKDRGRGQVVLATAAPPPPATAFS